MFKFTIRDLLWLTVVVALGVGWWVDHLAMAGRQKVTEEILIRRAVEAEMTAERAATDAAALRAQLDTAASTEQ